MNQFSLIIVFSIIIILTSCNIKQNHKIEDEGKEVTLLLEPRFGNPKNFSGDFIRLNDGSALYLDNHELINHDGAHAITEKSAAVTLRKGKHKIILKYF